MYFLLGTPPVNESCNRPGKMPQSREDGLEAVGVTVAGGGSKSGLLYAEQTWEGGTLSHDGAGRVALSPMIGAGICFFLPQHGLGHQGDSL